MFFKVKITKRKKKGAEREEEEERGSERKFDFNSTFFNGGLTSLSVGWQRGGEDQLGC